MRTGLLIGLGTVAWSAVMGVTGWYTDPTLGVAAFVPVVMLLEIGLIWLGLRETSARNRYIQQVQAGAMMAVIASIVIFFGAWLLTAKFFPLPPPSNQTPIGNAMTGVVGTLATGLVASAIIAVFVRRR